MPEASCLEQLMFWKFTPFPYTQFWTNTPTWPWEQISRSRPYSQPLNCWPLSIPWPQEVGSSSCILASWPQ